MNSFYLDQINSLITKNDESVIIKSEEDLFVKDKLKKKRINNQKILNETEYNVNVKE